MRVGDTRFVTEMVKLIEERVLKKLGNSAYVKRHMGIVASYDASTNTAEVYLFGSTVASGGFKVRSTSAPAVGDKVVVCIDDQDRWIESILHGVTQASVRSYPTQGYTDYAEIATPSSFPADNQRRLYFKDDGLLYSMNDLGVESPVSPTAASNNRSLNYVIDGGGSTITTGEKGEIFLDDAYTLIGWTLLGDQSGSITLDLWAGQRSDRPLNSGFSIISNPTYRPKIVTDIDGASTDLTSWTVDLPAGTALMFDVVSVTSLQRVTIALHAQRS